MPFTFSHPAIILPLTRLPQRYYSLTGLIAGTVVPDFEYFFRIDIYSHYSHNLPGLLYFNLPVGILLCYIFHGLVKKDLVANLPVFFRERSEPLLALDWPLYFRKNIPVICVSILVGAASHLFWDGFTHRTGYFVNLFGYQSVAFSLFGLRIFLYNFFQHLSTVFGLIFIYLYVQKMPASYVAGKGLIHYTYWTFVFLVCASVTAVRLLVSGVGQDAFGKIILTLISAFLIGMVLAPFLFRRFRSLSPKRLSR